MRRFTIPLALCMSALAGCSQHASPLPLPAQPQGVDSKIALRRQPDTSFKGLYSFQAIPDGSHPSGSLLLSNGTFYANAVNGGKNGFGAVYKVSTSGKESVLYSFTGAPNDGRYPAAGLAVKNGVFYGTTGIGGTNDSGTIFKVSASGAEHVIYSFKNAPDGQNPENGLVALNGTFYSTTQFGGQYGFGTVFKVSATGTEKVIYSFNENESPADGGNPVGDLVLVNGTFYGTTLSGGAGNHGTVFKISPSGAEHTLYAFKGEPDSSTPSAGLINVNGTLYGTTQFGGSSDHGTVFKITTSGVVHVIYSFKGSPDGWAPYARLVTLNGTLYGSTQYGGGNGLGCIFKVSTVGAEHVLYSFAGPPSDGKYPIAGMTAAGGVLYGTTRDGGTNSDGMIFKLTP